MKRMSLIVSLLALSACLVFALSACGSSSSNGSASSASSTASGNSAGTQSVVTSAEGEYASGTHHAVVKVQGYEPITIELNADAARVSVANFCELANSGYYNGLKFYRIVDGFCLQGGTKGNSASGQDASLSAIVGEFSDNDIDNPLAEEFKRGTVAMARTGVMNSAKSTFFITLSSSENVSKSLDGQYAAFGTIDDAGMAIIDSIVLDYLKYATGNSGAINNPDNMPVIESIEIVD